MTVARGRRARTILLVLAALAAVPSGAEAVSEGSALERLRDNAGGTLLTAHAPETDTLGWVLAPPGRHLALDGPGDPESRALRFLAEYGAALGLSDAERARIGSVFEVEGVHTDAAGDRHVRLAQRHEGLEVFGAQLVVHLDDQGVTGVNGAFVPGVDVSTVPVVPDLAAAAMALSAVEGATGVTSSERAVYRAGLVEGAYGHTSLAWAVEVTGPHAAQVWVDATTGEILSTVGRIHETKNRVVYTPEYMPEHPELFAVRTEDGPPNPVPPIDNLFRFSGQTYDLFDAAFGFDSYDGLGAVMRTVWLINDACPNAYWDGYTTNYCPGFDTDDIVGHEWGHAYTDATHDLIYRCQPGALNESYSDIWGEIVDLLNGEDGIGGGNVDQPHPQGQRWLVGEDLGDRVQQVLLRDMWNPTRLGDPDRVGAGQYHCGEDDNEGVHYNSGVPNHAFAMLTDGKTFRGIPVRGLGLTKTAHMYWHAAAVYQTPSSKFRDHDLALRSSCTDLLGVDLADLRTGQPSGEVLVEDDCKQVTNAMFAVEMSRTPRCPTTPVLRPGAPAICPDASVGFSEDFESGLGAWTLRSEGTALTDTWPGWNWEPRGDLPDGRTGGAAYAVNAPKGNCRRGPDVSGRFSMESPAITLPAAGAPAVRFDHYVATNPGSDGGNLSVSVNGGDFVLVPQDAYAYNPPNQQLAPPVGLSRNTNPKAGEYAWSGVDRGEVDGSWGTTIANLSGLAKPGDVIRLRFELGVNCAGGIDGWYVDDVVVYACPPATEP